MQFRGQSVRDIGLDSSACSVRGERKMGARTLLEKRSQSWLSFFSFAL
jgi:hypothetical protein